MFTGLVQDIGELVEVHAGPDAVRWWVQPRALNVASIALGESIAHDGVCLTATAVDVASRRYEVLLGPETLRRTALSERAKGGRVNLERAMQAGDRFGGHMVAGHVDGVGVVRRRTQDGANWRFEITLAPALARYVIEKGSICVDGVSLTVNHVGDAEFSVSLIPHTCDVTTLGGLYDGSRVNLEVDLIGKYVERLLGTHWLRALAPAQLPKE